MTETIHAVCVACNTTNRVPKDVARREVNCGKCHRPLFGQAPASLDAAGFEAQVRRSEIPVVVDFWAPWCGPCKAMAPAFAQVSLRLGGQARCIKVNTEDEPGLGSQFQIRSIPTLAVFKGGREVARMSGALPAAEMERWIRTALG